MVQYSLGWRIADYEETPGDNGCIQIFIRSGITVVLASNVFVAEVNRIQKFMSNAGFILIWS
jgi:hypothetical protein